ncbi:MAG: porin [Burkholderiales bacterium]|nr:porin [Burkholderiales bacterium]
MKKPFLVAMLLAAFSVSAAAQNSVTIYGLADAGIDIQRGGAAGGVTKLSSGIQNGSRLGFRGTEDLGGGNAALFVLEMGISIDNGGANQNGLAFGRQSFVGLRTTAGTITAGRQYTAVNNSLCDIDPFGCGLAGTAGNLFSVGGTPTNLGNGSRTNNAIKYATPAMGAFSGELTYAPGEVAGDQRAGRTVGGSLSYAADPFTLRFAHNAVVNPAGTSTAKVTFIGGKYNAGFATFALGYAVNKNAFSANTNIANPDSRDYILGVSVPAGPGLLMASYIRKRDRTAAANNASQAALGYSYPLSKRTNLYTSYARISNTARNTVAASFYTVGNAIDGGTGNSAFNVGLRHTF